MNLSLSIPAYSNDTTSEVRLGDGCLHVTITEQVTLVDRATFSLFGHPEEVLPFLRRLLADTEHECACGGVEVTP